jgi:OOP family OmpA-OmpF porin
VVVKGGICSAAGNLFDRVSDKMCKRLVLVLAGVFILLSPSFGKTDKSPSSSSSEKYIAVESAFIVPDGDRGTDDKGLGGVFTYGQQLTGNWFVEGQLFGNMLDTGPNSGTDFYQYGGGVDLSYRFQGLSRVTPYALGGVGLVHDDVFPEGEDSNNLYENVGVGLVTEPLGNVGLKVRAEARYLYDHLDFQGSNGMGDLRFGLGIEIPLGQRERVVKKVVKKEVPRDWFFSTTVQASIKDADKDGVPDRNDDCPDTLKGLATNNRGCVEGEPQVLRLEGVHFEFDSAQLLPGARPILKEVADSLKGEPELQVEIAGHTDSIGSKAYNRDLSERRAEAVRRFLLRQGIEPERLVAEGYGESQPVAGNDNSGGRQVNRRVEFRVLKTTDRPRSTSVKGEG